MASLNVMDHFVTFKVLISLLLIFILKQNFYKPTFSKNSKNDRNF